jgi:hypothetical protein
VPQRAGFSTRRGGEKASDVAIQVYCREFDGVAWHRAGIEAVEPAIGVDDGVPADAITGGLGVSRVGHLIEADGARGGLVHRGGVPSEPPAPIGTCDWITGALDLRQRRQQLGRDRVDRIRAEEEFVFAKDISALSTWEVGAHREGIPVGPRTYATQRAGIFAIGDIAHYPGKLRLILTGFAEAAAAAHAARRHIKPGRTFHFEHSTSKGVPSKA